MLTGLQPISHSNNKYHKYHTHRHVYSTRETEGGREMVGEEMRCRGLISKHGGKQSGNEGQTGTAGHVAGHSAIISQVRLDSWLGDSPS